MIHIALVTIRVIYKFTPKVFDMVSIMEFSRKIHGSYRSQFGLNEIPLPQEAQQSIISQIIFEYPCSDVRLFKTNQNGRHLTTPIDRVAKIDLVTIFDSDF